MILPAIENEYEVVVRHKIVQTCVWDINQCVETPTHLSIESVDRFASVTIDRQTLAITVVYQHHLPSKRVDHFICNIDCHNIERTRET